MSRHQNCNTNAPHLNFGYLHEKIEKKCFNTNQNANYNTNAQNNYLRVCV